MQGGSYHQQIRRNSVQFAPDGSHAYSNFLLPSTTIFPRQVGGVEAGSNSRGRRSIPIATGTGSRSSSLSTVNEIFSPSQHHSGADRRKYQYEDGIHW